MFRQAHRQTTAPVARNAFVLGLPSGPLPADSRGGFTATDPRVLRVLEIVGREFDKPLSVKILAAQLGLSPSRLEHFFKQQTGQPFKTLLRAVRMAKAKDALQDPTLRIKVVAAAVGYPDVSNFAHDFSKLYGRSPSRSRTSPPGASMVARGSQPLSHGHPFIALNSRSDRAFPAAGGKRTLDKRAKPAHHVKARWPR